VATPQIASAIHIVVTFNFRFGAHNGLNSDIAACPRCANMRQRQRWPDRRHRNLQERDTIEH